MKNTGIVRKIDELGRIVLPKELRRMLNINSGDDFQITIDDNKIILERYSKLENFEDKIINIINCFYSVNFYNIFVSINDKLLNNNELVTNVISNIIRTRKIYINDKIDKNIITNNLAIDGKIVILPIVLNSDLLGSIIIVSKDQINKIVETAKIINNLIKKMLV